MSGTMAAVVWVITAIMSVWAALLAVAEEAPAVVRAQGDRPVGGRVSLYRAVQASRLALVVIAGLGGGIIVTWWARPVETALWMGALAVVLFTLVVDTVPRSIAALSPRFATVLASVARASLAPFRPLLGLIAAVERALHILFPPAERVDDEVGQEERDILAGVISLRERTVAEAMTPRLDIFAVDVASDWPDVIELARKSEHARIPVFRDDLDDIVGVLYAKDLTAAASGLEPPPDEWRELVRPAHFVPESKSLAEQLHDFQRGPAHLAIVVDEFGGTSGLITLEDVLEEVVGEIHGEYDLDEEPEIEREGEDRFWVDGTVSLDELEDLLGVSFESEDVSTVGGLIYSQLGRVPRSGEEFRLGNFRVVVERVVRRRVHRVYFERITEDASAVEA
jgi:magnesium and cobalt transporter